MTTQELARRIEEIYNPNIRRNMVVRLMIQYLQEGDERSAFCIFELDSIGRQSINLHEEWGREITNLVNDYRQQITVDT